MFCHFCYSPKEIYFFFFFYRNFTRVDHDNMMMMLRTKWRRHGTDAKLSRRGRRVCACARKWEWLLNCVTDDENCDEINIKIKCIKNSQPEWATATAGEFNSFSQNSTRFRSVFQMARMRNASIYFAASLFILWWKTILIRFYDWPK